MFTRKRYLVTVTAAAILAFTVASCGQTTAPRAGGTPPGSPPPATTVPAVTTAPAAASPSTPPPTTPRASAAGQLAAFFTAAAALDGKLRHAAALVNEGTSEGSISLSPAAVAAARQLSIEPVAHAIPAGLTPELLRRVLLVYSDLESRRVPLVRFGYYGYPLSRSGDQGSDLARCLSNDAHAAARYPADLAALRDLAQGSAPVTLAAPESRTAAELALRLHSIEQRNSGCGECGGWIATTLARIVWRPENVPGAVTGHGHSDGFIDGVRFSAEYHAGTGWTIITWAC